MAAKLFVIHYLNGDVKTQESVPEGYVLWNTSVEGYPHYIHKTEMEKKRRGRT